MSVKSWKEIPGTVLISLFGENGNEIDPRGIYPPKWLMDQFGIPLELLPAKELIADPEAFISLRDSKGNQVKAMQGIVGADLIDAVAEGLGISPPEDSPRGFSGYRFALANSIVSKLKEREQR